jgi:hypothetical protein
LLVPFPYICFPFSLGRERVFWQSAEEGRDETNTQEKEEEKYQEIYDDSGFGLLDGIPNVDLASSRISLPLAAFQQQVRRLRRKLERW